MRGATVAGAHDTLDRIADWAKWMAGIQTATLATIGLMIKDRPAASELPTAVAAVLIMGAALFCNAWVLSALASIEIRISSGANPASKTKAPHNKSTFDVYNWSIYGNFGVPLSYVLTLQHWLWAIGLLCFTLFLSQFHAVSPCPSTQALTPAL